MILVARGVPELCGVSAGSGARDRPDATSVSRVVVGYVAARGRIERRDDSAGANRRRILVSAAQGLRQVVEAD